MLGAERGNEHPANCNPPADKAQRDVLCRGRRELPAAAEGMLCCRQLGPCLGPSRSDFNCF